MCPTFMVTGEEIMSTRGRANAIRAALELRSIHGDPLRSEELETALEQLPVLQSLHRGMPVQCKHVPAEGGIAARAHPARWIESARTAVQFGGPAGPARLRDAANGQRASGIPTPFGQLARRFLGFTTERPLPQFATERFDHWFENASLHPPVARAGDSVGRHLRALLRTARRHGRRQGAGNRGL